MNVKSESDVHSACVCLSVSNVVPGNDTARMLSLKPVPGRPCRQRTVQHPGFLIDQSIRTQFSRPRIKCFGHQRLVLYTKPDCALCDGLQARGACTVCP